MPIASVAAIMVAGRDCPLSRRLSSGGLIKAAEPRTAFAEASPVLDQQPGVPLAGVPRMSGSAQYKRQLSARALGLLLVTAAALLAGSSGAQTPANPPGSTDLQSLSRDDKQWVMAPRARNPCEPARIESVPGAFFVSRRAP